MKSFSSYIEISEASKPGKNVHMTHIEDRVIYGGVSGSREAILALRSLRDMLAGSTSSSTNVTVKWDGAPAVFAGVDPTDGQFFVAKKGIFNKEPKVYKSEADVRADTSGDLAEKLVIAFNELKDLGIKSPYKEKYDNFIGGKWVKPVDGKYFENITPISGKPFCEVARSNEKDIELALDAGHAAKDAWGKTSTTERANTLLKIADVYCKIDVAPKTGLRVTIPEKILKSFMILI